MIVFLLGISMYLHISDAYVMHRNDAREEPKSMTYVHGEDDPETRIHASNQKKHRERNSEDILEDIFNNAPDSSHKKQHGADKRGQHHKQHLKSNEPDLSSIVKGVINYLKSPERHSLRSGPETKIDLVKLVNGAFSYLAGLYPRYRASRSLTGPRPIELRSKEETSLLYEIDTKRIVEDVTNALTSKTVKGYVDNIARKAALIYKAVTQDDN